MPTNLWREVSERNVLADEPRFQPSDAVIADLELHLLGVALPWEILGGSLGVAPPPRRLAIEVPPEVVAAAVAAGSLLVTDREGIPLARLTNVTVAARSPQHPALSGQFLPERLVPRLQQCHPRSLSLTAARRTIVMALRPLMCTDVVGLRIRIERGEHVVILVPSAGDSPDGLPPEVLLRCVQLATCHQLAEADIVAVPLTSRDQGSDLSLARTTADAYGARDFILLDPDNAAWRRVQQALWEGTTTAVNVLDPAVQEKLTVWRPPPSRRGLVVFFTGLSGSGKSTLARALAEHVGLHTSRTVSLLDGDEVRRLLSVGLGFDRASRDLNVRRIGFVASEIARHHGMAVCAPIAPYAESRAAVRRMVGPLGDFVLVHLSTPLSVCESRDVKGLYAKARAGLVTEFTGVSDPYEEPTDADITVDTSRRSPSEALGDILAHLHDQGSIAYDEVVS